MLKPCIQDSLLQLGFGPESKRILNEIEIETSRLFACLPSRYFLVNAKEDEYLDSRTYLQVQILFEVMSRNHFL